jgi:DNA repair protein RadB
MRFSTGLPGLDDRLGGGAASRTLTLVYGEEKSGKTSLVLMMCALTTRQLPAAYIDCSGRLHSARISQIMKAVGGDEEKLYILSIESFQEQERVILSLHDLRPPARLLVFDDFTVLHRLELSGDIRLNMPVYRRLAFHVAALKEAALRNDLAIVIVGHVHDIPDQGEARAVAQRILGYWSDIILRLGLDPKTKLGKIAIEKPERAEATAYRITSSGLTQAQLP